jgi:hypothetical protein
MIEKIKTCHIYLLSQGWYSFSRSTKATLITITTSLKKKMSFPEKVTLVEIAAHLIDKFDVEWKEVLTSPPVRDFTALGLSWKVTDQAEIMKDIHQNCDFEEGEGEESVGEEGDGEEGVGEESVGDNVVKTYSTYSTLLIQNESKEAIVSIISFLYGTNWSSYVRTRVQKKVLDDIKSSVEFTGPVGKMYFVSKSNNQITYGHSIEKLSKQIWNKYGRLWFKEVVLKKVDHGLKGSATSWEDPPEETLELMKMLVHTRLHPKSKKICAQGKKGFILFGEDTHKKLYARIFNKYGDDWQDHILCKKIVL